MRFVCAVSMVIDHYCRNEERPYAGDKCWLTFTFSPSARNELDYLSGVLGLADEIHFVTYDEYGLPVATPEVYTYRNDPTSVLYRVYNQFYLFSFFPMWYRIRNVAAISPVCRRPVIRSITGNFIYCWTLRWCWL